MKPEQIAKDARKFFKIIIENTKTEFSKESNYSQKGELKKDE
mgnify:CR=1 FL=1